MLAGAIEFNSKHNLGNQLIALANAAEGLAHIPYDKSGSWTNGKVTLVQQLFWNTPESKLVGGITCHEQTGSQITAWARIDNRSELVEQLPQHLHHLARTDPGIILAAYLFWDDKVCDRLIGDFSFAIYDPRTERLFCGRDHLGVKPFYYYWAGTDFVFASSLAVLNKLKGINLALSENWMARYLHGCSVDWQATAYLSIAKLPPAHKLSLRREQLELKRYFSFSSVEVRKYSKEQDNVDSYRDLLSVVTKDRVRSDYTVGSELSGGLDSSTVTALAAQHRYIVDDDLEAFSMVTKQMDAECIIAVSTKSRISMTHLVTLQSRWNAELARDMFHKTNGVPEEHSDASGSLLFYESARKSGIRTMLSGFGGDEFVTYHGGLALSQLYHEGNYSDFLHRHRGRWLKYLRAAKWIMARHFYRYFPKAGTPLDEMTQKQWSRRLVSDRVAEQTGLRAHLLPDNFADDSAGFVSLNDFLLTHRLSPYMTARTENFTLMAAGFGIEYRWPLLDVRLIKHFLSIPAVQKFGAGGVSRYLHRRAVAGLIPDLITWKEKSMGSIIYPNDDSTTKTVPINLHPVLADILHDRHFEEMMKRLQNAADDKYSHLDSWGYDLVENVNQWLNHVYGK